MKNMKEYYENEEVVLTEENYCVMMLKVVWNEGEGRLIGMTIIIIV